MKKPFAIIVCIFMIMLIASSIVLMHQLYNVNSELSDLKNSSILEESVISDDNNVSYQASDLRTQLNSANSLLPENEKLPEELDSASAAEWITLVDEIDKENMNLYWQYEYYPTSESENKWKFSIYTSAGKYDNGEFLYDDRQEWLMAAETPFGYYPLVPRRYIQLGGISCTIFFDYNQRLGGRSDRRR